ncbi:TPA: hypothetical protein ACH3X1_012634 [Trebouxia sp. C0004]
MHIGSFMLPSLQELLQELLTNLQHLKTIVSCLVWTIRHLDYGLLMTSEVAKTREAELQLQTLRTAFQAKDKDFRALVANTKREDHRLVKEIADCTDRAKTLRKRRDVLQAEAVQRRAAAAQVEGAKYARDSLVLTKSSGRYWAGRVTAFLCHDPPGWKDCLPENQANVAEREDMDDPTGNLWPLERLSPCKLLSVPHASHASNLVVLSRFASFLDQVPEVQ